MNAKPHTDDEVFDPKTIKALTEKKLKPHVKGKKYMKYHMIVVRRKYVLTGEGIEDI